MLSNRNLDLTKIDVWSLPCIEHSPIYWDGEARKPFLSFQKRLTENDKKRILEYLKAGKCWSACPGMLVDDVSGKHLPVQWLNYTDGHYTWNSKTVYQFEHYDMMLPEDFVKFILNEDPE